VQGRGKIENREQLGEKNENIMSCCHIHRFSTYSV